MTRKRWVTRTAVAVVISGAALAAASGSAVVDAAALREAHRDDRRRRAADHAARRRRRGLRWEARSWLEDRGWGPHQQTDGGVKVQFAGYGGIILRHERLPSRFGAVVFRFLAPPGFDDFLTVRLTRIPPTAAEMPVVAVEPRHVARLAERDWREAMIPMRELNPLRVTFDQIIIKANRQVGPEWVSLDKIVLTAPSAEEDAGPPPLRKVSLSSIVGPRPSQSTR